MKILKMIQANNARRALAKEFNIAQMLANVVQLHRPNREHGNAYCLGCTSVALKWVEYPCPTIIVIREEM